MEKIINQKHSKDTYFITLSNAFERAFYYGIRILLFQYLISDSIHLENKKGIEIYSLFLNIILFTPIIGAIIGDKIIGNKKILVLMGTIFNSIGAFILCIPNLYGVYFGLFFIILGTSLYKPNIFSIFGQLYRDKNKIIDAGFSILNLGKNLGSFLGVLLIEFINFHFGWTISFITAGIIMMLSIVPLLKTNYNKIDNENKFSNKLKINKSVLIIVLFLLITIFLNSFSGFIFKHLFTCLKIMEFNFIQTIPKSFENSIQSILGLPMILFSIFIWNKYYISHYKKMIFALILFILSLSYFIILNYFNHLILITLIPIPLFLLIISEVLMIPIIESIIVQNSNPKYYASIYSIAVIPLRFFSFITLIYNYGTNNNLNQINIYILIISLITTLFLVLYYKKNNNN